MFAALGGLLLLPASACAAEGENVVLSFDKAGQATVWAAFAVGLVTLLYGLFRLRPFVMRHSPGDESMRSVGLAIKEGAVAYLRSQMGTMAPLVVVLIAGLVALNWRLGTGTALGVGACFFLGAAASYVSGTVGMLVAVEGNMRTANAALEGYKKSLIVAFRSGAVAGMVTVGIGLMGASAIVGLFPKVATSLLVGFAFGASLAALFMRVGGGIFTKAADVGADLVGKVEAGIPEDDPRNPAVIADNVGDNVGDCAGMAADVFESYEVTLIASIVLGAATASVFDAQTWPRLVVFALAVSAIGLVASMIGVELVTSKDDPNADPLKSLKRGFYIAIAATVAGVAVLAMTTMNGIRTSRLRSTAAYQQDEIALLRKVRAELAAKANKKPSDIALADVVKDSRVQKAGFDQPRQDSKENEQLAARLFATGVRPEGSLPDLNGFHEVDTKKGTDPVMDYAFAITQPANPMMQTPARTTYFPVRKAFEKPLVVAKLHFKIHTPAAPATANQPAQAERDLDVVQYSGPTPADDIDKQVENYNKQSVPAGAKVSLTVEERYPFKLYASDDGRIAYGIEGEFPHSYDVAASFPRNYYRTKAEVLEAQATPQGDAGVAEVGIVQRAPVEWWKFAACIAFGILLAFGIEYITDYFVSTNKKPTQEVAGVATAGAAPMVIQGFAHALTSSVYMTLAIGVGLVFPLLIFPPAVYGGYTLSFYGIALVGIGLLTTTGFVLAMDTFGPISDNAQGVFEMAGKAEEHPEAAHIVARLDAAGNTTKALTKGFAIATAVVAAVALFHSYLEGAQLSTVGLRLDVPEIFLGLLIGAAAPFLFSAFAIDAVGRASFDLIDEVRRQFRENPGIMTREVKPDYARCVALVTKAAQKELLAPGVLAIALPIAVGFGFSIGKAPVAVGEGSFVLTGAQALGGFLAGAIASGQLMAVMLANAGGMWDNAKKLIEDGLHGGKGTDAHKAAVVGDTIGDPFKDTAGPALNPLLKVMNLVAVLISAVIIQPLAPGVTIGVTAVCLVLLVGSIMRAKSGSMSSALQQATGSAPIEARAEAVLESPAPAPEAPQKRKLFVDDDEA